MNSITLNSEKSRFELEIDGQIAVADFVLQPGEITITHVIVPPSLRGGGVASRLGAEVVAYSKRENLRIVPQCSFMAAYLERHSE